MIRVLDGDMRDVVPTLDRIDAVVTDPPYHLTNAAVRELGHPSWNSNTKRERGARKAGFMGKEWDGGDIAFQADTWWPVFTALKPGGHLVAFGGSRTFHRMVCAIEDAGFEIRDTLMWLYGTGFAKSHNISVAIDKAAGAAREVIGLRQFADGTTARATAGRAGVPGSGAAGQAVLTAPATPEAAYWQGWGSALKPAVELICLARRPLEGTLAQNTLKHGVGGLNIDASRIEADEVRSAGGTRRSGGIMGASEPLGGWRSEPGVGRWPANVLHDGSDEVLEAFAAYGERTSGSRAAGVYGAGGSDLVYGARGEAEMPGLKGSTGTAARFFKSCGYSDSELLLCSAKDTFGGWNGSINASDAGRILDPRSEQFASALSDAVAQSMQPLGLLKPSYQGRPTNVTASELRTVCASVTALIQNIAQRCSQEWPDGKLTLHNDPVNCVALQKPTGITTITVSLSKSDGCAELATFDITPMNSEPGEAVLSGSRFHYTSKADKADRADSRHPTVKPLDLMLWLTKLVCPPGGTVLDPFAGSGVTAEACMLNGFDCILVEKNPEYCRDIRHRVARWSGLDTPLFAEVAD